MILSSSQGDRAFTEGDRAFVREDRVLVGGDRVLVGGDRVLVGGDRVFVAGERVFIARDRVSMGGSRARTAAYESQNAAVAIWCASSEQISPGTSSRRHSTIHLGSLEAVPRVVEVREDAVRLARVREPYEARPRAAPRDGFGGDAPQVAGVALPTAHPSDPRRHVARRQQA
jgi:hypothetical protein